MQDVFMEVLVPRSLPGVGDAREVFEVLLSTLPALTPEKCGFWEPLKRVFDPADLDGTLEGWDSSSFFWKRRKPRTDGGVSSTKGVSAQKQHSSIYIATTYRDGTALSNASRMLATGSRADFGYVTLLVPGDIPAGRAAGTVHDLSKRVERLNHIITTHRLVKYLPDLYWVTIFGRPYLELIGRDRLLSAPAYRVEELAPDLIYLQLSENLTDLKSDYTRVAAVREAVKAHLGREHFFDLHLGPDHGYNTPHFQFERPVSQVG